MKRRVHISVCTDEDILAEDIWSPHGAFLLPKGTVFNQYIICKLKELGIKDVMIFNEKYNKEETGASFKVFEKEYNDLFENIKDLMCGLARGKKINCESVRKITNRVICVSREPDHIVRCLSKIKDSDDYTYYHCLNVSFYSMLLAIWLGLSRDDIKIVVEAGLLHDIGKTQICAKLLNKKEKLTPEEFCELKRHVVYGYEMVKDNPRISKEVKDVILMHHEREDGSGYPSKASGNDISNYTKIVAIADVYDAMTSDRAYKKAKTPFKAFEEFLTIGRGAFDVHILNTLLYNITRYFTGSKVLLNNGKIGNIAYIPPQCIWRPIVDMGTVFLDLSKEKEVSVEAMV